MIVLDEVSKSYSTGAPAIKNISLKIWKAQSLDWAFRILIDKKETVVIN